MSMVNVIRFIRKEVVLNYCTHLPAKKNNINPIDFFINFLFIIYKYKNSSAIFIIVYLSGKKSDFFNFT
jgi:hypothetical protein